MSLFSSNLPSPPRSRFSRCPVAASGGPPLGPSFAVVPASAPAFTTIVSPSPDEAGSLAPIPSHGHSISKDVDTPSEPLELA